jgi:hypothetical protein
MRVEASPGLPGALPRGLFLRILQVCGAVSRQVKPRALMALLAVALLGAYAQAAGPSLIEARKIDFLISAVATLSGAQFIRNGKTYDAQAAADHLRLKLRAAGSKVATAEDFIRYCGSVSSFSGIPYQIRFSDGRTVTSEEFLREKLVEFEQSARP